MRTFKALQRVVLAACVAVGLLAVATNASAVTLNVCVPEKEGATVKTPKAGKCAAKYNESSLLPKAEAEELEKIKQDIKYVASGVGGKATIQFSGVNVQIVNGEGETTTTNGEGNLVIGYNELPREQTGSHNLILGDEQAFTSYGGILGGKDNTISGPYASVTGGLDSVASGPFSSVSGGFAATASGESAWVSGGEGNTASGLSASADGGYHNTASGGNTLASGGSGNVSEGNATSTSGGKLNKASGPAASISGGEGNAATGKRGLGKRRRKQRCQRRTRHSERG